MNHDENHVRLLSIFYYVTAGLAALFACIPFIHIALGIAMISGAFDSAEGGPPPEFLGWLFVFIGAFIIVMGLVFALMLFLTGRFMGQHRHYTFCLVMAGISCLFMPFGTVLGIFTIVVLSRPAVKAMFNHGAPAPQT